MEELHMIDLVNDLPQIDVGEISESPMTRFPGTEPNFGLRHHIMMNAMLHIQKSKNTEEEQT